MYWSLSFILCGLLVQTIVAPPVTKDKANEEHKEKDHEPAVMEYHRYLKEVVDALESDPEFRSKLEKAQEEDIRTGKIAHELEFVNYKIRTRLDELKREELERLRHLAIKENQLNNGLDLKHLKIAEHLDHSNTRSFEINDLKKLIAKTTEDLAEADRRRRQQFKEYEMEKKFEQEQKIKAMDEKEKEQYIQHLQEVKKKHKNVQLHHPGSKQQLEDVWAMQDDMGGEDFDLKKFFYIHDIDDNGVWDQNEVKALFLKDLNEMYGKGIPEEDLLEKEEEMERMREHVFNEADLNKDGLISYQEFLEQTKKPDFQDDPGWKPLDEQQIYSQEEYEAFEKRRREELIAKGILQPQQDNIPPQNQQFSPHGNIPVQQQVVNNQANTQQQYQYQGQPVQQQYNPQQIPIQQQQQQHYQGQVPMQQQGHYQHQQHQQYQGQIVPQNGQFHEQIQSNQIPVHPQIQQAQQIQQQQLQQQQLHQQQLQQQQLQQRQQQQQQQQQNTINQIPQQPNIQNTISQQQQPIQNQIPSIPGQSKENPVVQQQSLPLATNSAQQAQQNSIHNAGKV
ncbi:nucleobindin-2-like [Vespa mandarinia]|uniref:nucleobindin-2-like n=1 Tax=Vespa mandarinia TaxID=7446 RepID=UPI00160A318D|nr:nucleobindin-2-like [Vespa mandarinia]XP_035721863.1 nucleobindin-2-like [Vespa mandarinia]